MGNKKQVRTINRRYGKAWWSDQAGKPHRRGNSFDDPEVRRKAKETREQNKLRRLLEDEIQDHTDV